jgi:predicted SnoaL-like aldol condensation-catalyzing enzyme
VRWGIPIAVLLACSGSEQRSEPPAPTPEHALAQLRAYAAARDSIDIAGVTPILSPSVVALAGDPVSAVTDYGREALMKKWKARIGKTDEKCTLELALAGARDAFGLVYCEGNATAKTAPLKRPRKMFRIYELAIGDDGTITRITMWWDNLRAWRQIGVMEEADPRPDVPTGRAIVAVARGDQREVSNERVARAIVDALDRREWFALEQRVAAGFVHRRFSEPDPRTFAAPSDFTRFMRDELAACSTSTHRTFSTVAAADWVAVRVGHGCARGDDHSFAMHVWLLRFVDGRVVEGWDAWARQEELRQQGKFSVPDQTKRIAAGGF